MNIELKEYSKYSRAILDAQSSIVYVRSRQRILDANLAFFEFFDFIEREELLNNGIYKYFESDEEEGFLQNVTYNEWIDIISKENDGKSFRKIKITKNSKPFFFSINAKNMPKIEELGEIELFIVTLTDITEIEEIRHEKMRNLTLASIGKLAAGVTHEINTPLTYAKGNIEILKLDIEGLRDIDLRRGMLETAKSIDEALIRISKIVESMREIAGKGSGKKERIDILRTVVLALRMIHNRSKHIAPIFINDSFFSIDLNIGESSCFVFAERQRMEQIWIIIINNALDEFIKGSLAYEQRSIKIYVKKDGEFCKILVKDNAGGIEPSIQDKLFEPFSSLKTSSGMGIGLNIAKQIINEHKGTIRAYNEDKGAVFEVLLPCVEGEG